MPAIELAPASAITLRKKYEIALGFLGDKNNRRGRFTPGAVRWR